MSISRGLGRLCFTGEEYFIKRYRPLFEALSRRASSGEIVSAPRIPEWVGRREYPGLLRRRFPLLRYLLARRRGQDIDKTSWIFDYKTKELARETAARKPDLVFHLFAQSSPVGEGAGIPYGMSLDYTMALAMREYPAWAAFPSERARHAWLERERKVFSRANCLFPWSQLVADSLVRDYGVDPSKIFVTGSSGNFDLSMGAGRTYGTRRLFMNASDFGRKGGDLAVAAMPLVRRVFPEARLCIAGCASGPVIEGVEYLGHIGGVKEMAEQFLRADMVLAPARCEPYGSFLVEAMAYGTPCLVSNVGGMPEIVDHGINGRVLASPQVESLAREIIQLLQDSELLANYGARARGKVQQVLNWDAIANKVVEAFVLRRGLR